MSDPKYADLPVDVPLPSPTWVPDSPALDLDPDVASAENPDPATDDNRDPPARSGGAAQDSRTPTQANNENRRVDPASRLPQPVKQDLG